MTVKIEETNADHNLVMVRTYDNVTEIKEIVTHSGETYPEIHEYYSYWYELWEGDKKLGGFSKNEHTKVYIKFNELEQLQ